MFRKVLASLGNSGNSTANFFRYSVSRFSTASFKEYKKGETVIGLLKHHLIDGKYVTMFPRGTCNSPAQAKVVSKWMGLNESGLGLFKLNKNIRVEHVEVRVDSVPITILNVSHEDLYPFKELHLDRDLDDDSQSQQSTFKK